MITPAHTILNEIKDINSIIKKYPYCKNVLNSRLNFLQNKINFINKYTYTYGSGDTYYIHYDNGIMNWSKKKLEKELKEIEGKVIGGLSLDNEKALIRKVIKERILKDLIDNHLKIKYTTKIVKEKVVKDNKKNDDYELIEAY